MGCGCSISDRQINPIDTPPVSPEHGWITANGVIVVATCAKPSTNQENQSEDDNENCKKSASTMSCGVDTRSLNSMIEYNSYWNKKSLSPLRISTGTQCGPVDKLDVAVNTAALTKQHDTFNGNVVAANNRDTLPSANSSVDNAIANVANRKIDSNESTVEIFNRQKKGLNFENIQPNDVELLEELQFLSDISNRLDDYECIASDSAKQTFRATFDRVASECTQSASEIQNNILKNNVNNRIGNDTSISSQVSKCNVGIQTDVLGLADGQEGGDAPELAPRPPSKRKVQLMMYCNSIKIIQNVAQIPGFTTRKIEHLVAQIMSSATSELEIVYGIFLWITNNIRYELKFADLRLDICDILDMRFGVAKDLCNLFSEMCRIAAVREKQISGFAKGPDFKIGHMFKPNQDGLHIWNAVFLNGSWRLVDCTLGAGFINSMGKFQSRYNEHYFLTDPDVFIWTHFPHKEGDLNYFRWQLLETPLSLDEFNSRPKVSPSFFQYQVKIEKHLENPIIFSYTTQVELSTPETMRYKYKFFSADRIESAEHNQYVFCHLRDKRLCGCFQITPPVDGSYILKVYSHPEDKMKPDTILRCIVVFVLNCVKTWKNVPKYPEIDIPWGPTRFFAEFGLKMVNHSNPIVVIISGRKTLMFETIQTMLFSQQLFDVHGKQILQKGTLHRDEGSNDNIVKFIIQPPNISYYKLMIFACPKPIGKGQFNLPCVATFAINCKQSRASSEELRGQVFIKSKSAATKK